MKKIKKQLMSVCLIFMILGGLVSPLTSLVSLAASCSFSMSGATVNVGDTFTVTLSCSWEGANLLTYSGSVSYDASYLELVSGDLNIAESDGFKEESYTFKALKAGTTTVSYNPGGDAYGETETEPIVVMSCSSSGGTVTIVEPTVAPPTTEAPTTAAPTTAEPTTAAPTTEAPTTATPTTEAPTTTTQEPTTAELTTEALSDNAYLEALSIYPGTLSPAFNPNTTIYEITVKNDVAKLSVSAATADVDATYIITDTNLEVGKNVIDIKVTAADGTVRWYAIRVTRQAAETTEADTTEKETSTEETTETPTDTTEASSEADPLEVAVGSTTAYVQETLEDVEKPEGFEEIAYDFRGVEVEALKGLGNSLLLLPVSDGTGTKLYIYNEENDGLYPYVGIQITSALYTVLPFDDEEQIPNGYKLTVADFGGSLIDAWVRTDAVNNNFVLFYAMNWEGVTGLYRYDAGENTLQRVNKDELVPPATETESQPETESSSQPESSGGSVSPVDDEYLTHYEETLKKVNRRDTIMFVIMIILLLCLIAMYLLFASGRKDDSDGSGDDPDDDFEYEDVEEDDGWDEAFSDEDELAAEDSGDIIAEGDAADRTKALQKELEQIQLGMAEILAEFATESIAGESNAEEKSEEDNEPEVESSEDMDEAGVSEPDEDMEELDVSEPDEEMEELDVSEPDEDIEELDASEPDENTDVPESDTETEWDNDSEVKENSAPAGEADHEKAAESDLEFEETDELQMEELDFEDLELEDLDL